MPMRPDCSIVIAHTAPQQTLAILHNLRWLEYDGDFEVIVVSRCWETFPGELAEQGRHVALCYAPEAANLSALHNIGLQVARADRVAFVAADAVCGYRWLAELQAGFTHEHMACVSGQVVDTSREQRLPRRATINRLGTINSAHALAQECYNFPFSDEIALLHFQNVVFDKKILTSVCALDPNLSGARSLADVCFQLVDAGYDISVLDAAPIFFDQGNAASSFAKEERNKKIEEKILFSLKHAKAYRTDSEITSDNIRYAAHVLRPYCVENGLPYGRQDYERIIADRTRSVEAKLSRPRPPLHAVAAATRAPSLFPRATTTAPQVLVLVSRDYPPNHQGGIATFNKDLAEALAQGGHVVHVITEAKEKKGLFFENGVWIHRIEEEPVDQSLRVWWEGIPPHLWNWSACAYKEVCRLAQWETISCIEAPIWDCEGIAFLVHRNWPLVTSLQTTLHYWLESNHRFVQDKSWMRDIGRPTLRTEKELMLGADAVRSISCAIKNDLEAAYSLHFDPQKIRIHPLGLRPYEGSPREIPVSEGIHVLFVGRLECRKGIDVLFLAMESVLNANEKIEFTIIGKDTILSDDGILTYKEKFFQSRCWQQWSSRISFLGHADDETLLHAYQDCDIFVAPSRFESFGLVFLEAMKFGKPVIGCNVGGIPEIIEHERTGLLVDVGDAEQLSQAILRLAASEQWRLELGRRGMELFERKFTAAIMAQNSLSLYALAQKNFQQTHSRAGWAERNVDAAGGL